MDTPVTFGGAVLLLNALTQLVKRVVPDQYLRFIPLGVEVVGFGLGLAIGLSWFEAMFVGLSAMGLYSGTKSVVKGN